MLFAAFDGGGAPGRVDQVLDVVGLQHWARDKVGGYSQGMKSAFFAAVPLAFAVFQRRDVAGD